MGANRNGRVINTSSIIQCAANELGEGSCAVTGKVFGQGAGKPSLKSSPQGWAEWLWDSACPVALRPCVTLPVLCTLNKPLDFTRAG